MMQGASNSAQQVFRFPGNVAAMATKVPAALWADLKAERLLAADAPVPT